MTSLETYEDEACSIYLSNTKDHEGRMQTFFRSHIVNILRPLADRVQALQSEFSNLSEGFAKMDTKTEQMHAQLGQHNQEVQSLRGALSVANTRLDQAETNISGCHDEVYRVEGMHERSRQAHNVLQRDLDSTVASFVFNSGKVLDVEAFVEKLQASFDKSATAIAEHEESITQIFDHLKALRNGHSFAKKDLDAVMKACQRNERAITASMQAAENARAEDSANVGRLREQLEFMENILADANRKIDKHQDISKENTADITKLKSALHAESGTLSRFELLQRKVDESVNSVGNLTERMQKVETDMLMSQEASQVSQANASELMQGLQKKHVKLSAVVMKLEEAQSNSIHQIKKLDWSLSEQQKEFRRSQEHQNDLDRNLLPNLETWRQEVNKRFENTTAEFRTTRVTLAEQQKALRGKGGFEENLAKLANEVEIVKERLSSLGASQDAHKKSLVGLSRGLEDTYRNVVLGENGMLSPLVPATNTSKIRPSTSPVLSSSIISKPERPIGSAPQTGRRAVDHTCSPEKTGL